MAGIRFTEITKREILWLEENCNFTPDELAVFRLRTAGASVIGICMQLHMSERTAQRRIQKIKKKILRAL